MTLVLLTVVCIIIFAIILATIFSKPKRNVIRDLCCGAIVDCKNRLSYHTESDFIIYTYEDVLYRPVETTRERTFVDGMYTRSHVRSSSIEHAIQSRLDDIKNEKVHDVQVIINGNNIKPESLID